MLFTPMGPPLYLHTIASILRYKELVDIGLWPSFGNIDEFVDTRNFRGSMGTSRAI